MNAIESLRKFRDRMITRISAKTSWGKLELKEEINILYTQLLEEIFEEKKSDID